MARKDTAVGEGVHAAAVYHLVSLASHATCAVLLAALFMRRLSRRAALLGAVFFAAHPAVVALAGRFEPATSGGSRRGIIGVTLGLAAISLAYGAAFVSGNAFGVRADAGKQMVRRLSSRRARAGRHLRPGGFHPAGGGAGALRTPEGPTGRAGPSM